MNKDNYSAQAEHLVGRSEVRVDAFDKVTGRTKYYEDRMPGDALYVRIKHSTIAHGFVKNIDTSCAEKIPGVVKVLTCFDVPDIPFPTAGHPWSMDPGHQDVKDRLLLNRHVRYYGDDVAVVIAENEVAANQGVRALKVEYEELPFVLDVQEAMKDGAPQLHDSCPNNILKHTSIQKGNYAEAIKEPGLIKVEGWYETPTVQHCHIENHGCFAYEENGRLTVVASTQIPHIIRRVVGQALGRPWADIEVIKPYIGGGFGNKQDVLYEPLNAFLSMSVGGRPVRLEISREETISGTRTRHAIKGKCRGVVTKDGEILARQLEAYANNGAYASHGHAICANCGNVFKDLYRDRLGTEVDCWTVYTSSPTAGAMRAYGIPQADWFAECLTDDLAEAIGMDPCELRLKNCMEEGFVDPSNGITFHSYGLKKCIEEGRRHIHWDEKWNAYKNQTGPVRKGVGMAIFCYKTGVHPISLETASVRMVLNQDGSMQVCMGATEIGQGADTVFSQMASQTTGISFDKVYIMSTQDTDITPFDTGAYASRQTYVSGMACKKCGEELRHRILEYAAYMLNHDVSDMSKTIYADTVKDAAARLRDVLGLNPEEEITEDMLDIQNSQIVVNGGDPVLFDVAVVADTAFYSLDRSIHLTAEVTNHCKDNTFSSGCCFVEIEVDMPLGLITVKDIINVHDSGILINPATARAQVHGGMSMGLGYGLSEELLIDEKTGRPLNNNLLDYKIPTAMDTPDLNVSFIQLEDPTGPFGNKSLGEPPAIPVAPAIRNALLNATGVHMNVTPMTAQRLIEKFKEKIN